MQYLQGFIEQCNEIVTGQVKLRMFKGGVRPIARKSPNSIYERKLATYEADDEFKHSSAEGFIDIYGMPMRIQARRKVRGIK